MWSLSFRDLCSLNAKGICSTLSLGSKPTYHTRGKSLRVRLMLSSDGLTLFNIPASARAMYAPREKPSRKMSDSMDDVPGKKQ